MNSMQWERRSFEMNNKFIIYRTFWNSTTIKFQGENEIFGSEANTHKTH